MLSDGAKRIDAVWSENKIGGCSADGFMYEHRTAPGYDIKDVRARIFVDDWGVRLHLYESGVHISGKRHDSIDAAKNWYASEVCGL